MNITSTASTALAIVIAAAVGCTTNTNTNNTTADGGVSSNDGGALATDSGATATDAGIDRGDCVPYEPASISGTKTDIFASAELVKIPLPPTDQGGGLLKVTYTQAASVVASLFLPEGSLAADPRVESTAFGPGVTDDKPVQIVYRLAAKKSYVLGIKPFVYDNTKASYTVEYSYQALSDCYEPNDALTSAKRIPVNTPISAYHHTGIDTEDTGLANASGDDWYTFELAAPKTVKLKGELPGKDGAGGGNSALFTIYTADGATKAECSGPFETDPVAATEAVETCEGVLPAGKYFVRLAHFTSQKTASDPNATFNKSWDTAYSFTVEAK